MLQQLFYPEKGEIPENGQYVVALLKDMPWNDAQDPTGVMWKVVKFIKGRKAEEIERFSPIGAEDQSGNNRRPYCWEEFGPGSHFGQDVEAWFHLPLVQKG